MKTVADLIEVLKMQDQQMKVQVIYDTFEEDLNVFVSANGKLCFSNVGMDSECNDCEILFKSEVR